MNKRRTALALAAVLTWAAVVSGLELGETAPLDHQLMSAPDGSRTSIAQVAGKRGTLVLFLCVHCPWVQKWSTRIAEIGETARHGGIGVIAVNSNDPARVRQDGVDGMVRQIHEFGFTFPYVVDSGSLLARAFAAQRTPEAYLFDATGRLVYRGTVDDNAYSPGSVRERFLLDAVRAVAAGKKPPLSESKALGCTLKLYPE